MKRKVLGYLACACLVAAAILIGIGIGTDAGSKSEYDAALMENLGNYTEIKIGDTSIGDYVIICPGSAKEGRRLSGYIADACGKKIKSVSGGNHEHYIKLVRDNTLTDGDVKIFIENGEVTIKGSDAKDMGKQVDIFANRYLGIAFAGTFREHVLACGSKNINIPSDVFYDEEPWMPEREPIICLWKTNAPRGVFYNQAAALDCELLSYSDDMLYDYVRMMGACGYTGIQVTDMCSAWAYYGNYEFVHDRLRFMADAAHSLGMKFTLWVWGAEFNGYGWNDTSVAYYGKYSPEGIRDYDHASDNPEAKETFERYYSIYASLADCCDRVIAHYNDPGNLENVEDIAFYASMLKSKVKSANPDVNFGVSCYTHDIDPRRLTELMGTDTTVYLGAMTAEDSDWTIERQICGADGIDFGIWSWNLTEMEIDQLAEMNVNADLIKDVYTRTAAQDEFSKPSYWSEMDSYHVLNIFSHYVAARLLQDPGLDSGEVLMEAAEAVAGEEYAGKMYEVLCLIEDARTGKTWESFRWECDDYILKSDKYAAGDIIKRSEKALLYLEEMENAGLSENTIPLPVSVTDLIRLIEPHVSQINEFAQFRQKLSDAEKKAAKGADTGTLQQLIDEIYVPVSEYNVITGVWGIPEARAQYEMTEEFCSKYGLDVPRDPVFIYYRKQRIYNEFVTWQRKSSEKQIFDIDGFQWGFAFGKEETARLTRLLIDEGLLTKESETTVSVTGWERYRYDHISEAENAF